MLSAVIVVIPVFIVVPLSFTPPASEGTLTLVAFRVSVPLPNVRVAPPPSLTFLIDISEILKVMGLVKFFHSPLVPLGRHCAFVGSSGFGRVAIPKSLFNVVGKNEM